MAKDKNRINLRFQRSQTVFLFPAAPSDLFPRSKFKNLKPQSPREEFVRKIKKKKSETFDGPESEHALNITKRKPEKSVKLAKTDERMTKQEDFQMCHPHTQIGKLFNTHRAAN